MNLCDEYWLNRSLEKLNSLISKEKIISINYEEKAEDMIVCLCFFSIVEYKKPIENFNILIEKLKKSKIPFKVISVLFPNQKKNIDADFWMKTDSVLFYKENLYNILYSKIKKDWNKFCFIDCDLIFSDKNWHRNTSLLLNEFDLIQPFDTCKWIQKNNITSDTGQLPSSVALHQGIEFTQAYYHPGFSWAFNKKAFDKINGFYDWVAIGEGDICFVNSFLKNKKSRMHASFTTSEKYNLYAENLFNQNLKIGFLRNNTASHLYHGCLKRRDYDNRHKYVSDVIRNKPEDYLVRDPDGLIRWKYPSKHNNLITEYFKSRQEDD